MDALDEGYDRPGRESPAVKPLRDALGLLPGTTVDVSQYGAGLQLIPAGRTARIVEEDGALVATGETQIDDDTALAAVEHGADLATRDGRARGTCEAVSARVIVVA